jgi:hypothetical protein
MEIREGKRGEKRGGGGEKVGDLVENGIKASHGISA